MAFFFASCSYVGLNKKGERVHFTYMGDYSTGDTVTLINTDVITTNWRPAMWQDKQAQDTMYILYDSSKQFVGFVAQQNVIIK